MKISTSQIEQLAADKAVISAKQIRPDITDESIHALLEMVALNSARNAVAALGEQGHLSGGDIMSNISNIVKEVGNLKDFPIEKLVEGAAVILMTEKPKDKPKSKKD